ncbi:unnamed protein product [Mytilus coruscus]|uniref:DZIP3-like HEPN domain-containing protein n=1 Tax=Mytilus coruscus TaxID=42192 RepID=A0A6J8CM10_MYTCO|nr:unnamed protein product [Mytilus coruscus]
MMILMKNLTELDISEKLPLDTDTSEVAWLSRIKYFRNKLVQNSDKKISDEEFEKDWNELSKAVIQLGGKTYEKICNDRKTFNPSPQQCQNYLHSGNLQSDQIHRTSVDSIKEFFIRDASIQTLAKEAVRERFDKQFVPGKLAEELTKQRKHLESLKEERVITQSQWDNLFPTDKGNYRLIAYF